MDAMCAVHGSNGADRGVVNASSRQKTDENGSQATLDFVKPAPDSVVARITSEAHAIKVSIVASQMKQAYLAAKLGVSPTYLTLMKKGDRPVPEWIVTPFCVHVGSMLLKQYREFQAALRAMRGEGQEDADQRLARELRGAK